MTMTALIALIRKDLILYLNDKRALMLHLLMPIVLAAFFGAVLGGGSDAQNSKIQVGLVQLDQSANGRKIADGLKADPALTIVELSDHEAQAKVKEGKLPVALVIPAGFGEGTADALFSGRNKPELLVYYDPSQSAVLGMAKGMVTQHVMQVTSAAVMNPTDSASIDRQLADIEKMDPDSPMKAPLQGLFAGLNKLQQDRAASAGKADGKDGKAAPAEQPAGMSVPYTTKDVSLSSGPKYNAYSHALAGMGVQFILFMGIDMGIGILLARRLGIWNRLLAAPVSLTTVLMGRAASGATIAMGIMCTLFVAGVLLFKVEISSVAGFAGIALCFALMTAAFGLCVAAFGRTPEAARGIASFATLILVMLGGAWMPTFIFPQWVQTATLVVPTRWAIDGFDAVTWRGLGFDAAIYPMAVQLGFAVLFGGLAIWKFLSDQHR